MSERIWAGQCEDCYGMKPLRDPAEELIPHGIRAELCADCIAAREADRDAGRPSRPVGIPADEPGMEWVDLSSALTYRNGIDNSEFVVEVRFRRPVSEANGESGEVRFRFKDGAKWFPGCGLDFIVPAIRCNPVKFALGSVMGAVRGMLPHAKLAIVRQRQAFN